MKKIVLVLVAVFFVFTLSSCKDDDDVEIIDIPEEGIIYKHNLPYYEYMSLGNPVVTITIKDIGVITIELFPSLAPNTVNNLINYIENDVYTDVVFHRVIADFMIQAGELASTPCPISGEFSENGFENDLLHYRGVLSTARTEDEDSATSQFFIVHQDSFTLNGYYAAFGGVVSGFNVLDYIANVYTDSYDRPYIDIVIESMSVELNGYVASAPICAD
ncbi:MAG: peptidylprolyl isomerase [Candidatus Izemoplasma sp.]